MLPINKIFVDSRHKTLDSRSNTDFKIQLKESINLPNNTICFITDVVIPNTIYTIEYFLKTYISDIQNQMELPKITLLNFLKRIMIYQH